jgi:hypothetical protein
MTDEPMKPDLAEHHLDQADKAQQQVEAKLQANS